jgi:NAD(P)-dependent dehydrogenase (short-subunit alcohol dehydrogenase family)
MEQKVALITGANSGMGKATAIAFAKMGFYVVMLCRNQDRGIAALHEVISKSTGNVALMLCDLSSLADIKRFCDEFIQKHSRLDILVNNAGVITLDRRETKDGLELQFGVNHIGHFALTNRLLDLIVSTDQSRVVVVGSGAHKIGKIDFDNLPLKKGYNVISAYSRAKLCNILFTKELARRLSGTKTTINCVHPGAVATNMGVDRDTGFGKTIIKMLKPFFQTSEQGARTAIYVATSDDCKGINGEYFYKSKIHKPSKKALSKELAEKLWQVSENIINSIYFQ